MEKERIKRDLGFVGHQRGKGRRGTTIRDMNHLHARHLLEHLAAEMLQGPFPAEAMLILPGLALAYAMDSGMVLAGMMG